MTDERYWSGIRKFNDKEFFEAHEILEDLWRDYRESDRTYLQALIQVSAGMYHADAGNFRGARSQLAKGLQKLSQYPAAYQGVDLHTLVQQVSVCLATVERCELGESKFSPESFFPTITFIPNQSQESEMHHGDDDY